MTAEKKQEQESVQRKEINLPLHFAQAFVHKLETENYPQGICMLYRVTINAQATTRELNGTTHITNVPIQLTGIEKIEGMHGLTLIQTPKQKETYLIEMGEFSTEDGSISFLGITRLPYGPETVTDQEIWRDKTIAQRIQPNNDGKDNSLHGVLMVFRGPQDIQVRLSGSKGADIHLEAFFNTL